MTRLVLHVGPGKCGSTFIRHSFAGASPFCEEKVHFVHLDAARIEAEPTTEPLEAAVSRWLDEADAAHTLVLSHTVLFKHPEVVATLARAAADRVAAISIVGYSRRQSAWLSSAWAQWFFASPERTAETKATLRAGDLDSNLLSGMERFFAACVLNDFASARQLSGQRILDWRESYAPLADVARATGAALEVGTLPGRDEDNALARDFCARAGLTYCPRQRPAFANRAVHPDTVEAINAAVELGLDVPHPHVLQAALKSPESEQKTGSAVPPPSPLLEDLRAYTDSYFWPSNQQFCAEQSLEPARFAPQAIWSRQEILDRLRAEVSARQQNPEPRLREYQRLLGRLAARLIR